MSTASQIERARAAAATAGAVRNPGGAAAARSDDRATCLAAAEAMAAAAVETARQAAAAAAVLLDETEREPVDGSRSLAGHRLQSPSPERRRGRRGCSPVVQTIYCDSKARTPWLMLTRTNYHEWSLLMKVRMQARQIWDMIKFGDVEFHNDRRALEALCATVPPEISASLANKAMAKEAWDSIATTCLDDHRIHHATLLRLRQEWEGLAFNRGEQVEDFAFRLSSLKEQMARRHRHHPRSRGGEAPALHPQVLPNRAGDRDASRFRGTLNRGHWEDQSGARSQGGAPHRVVQ